MSPSTATGKLLVASMVLIAAPLAGCLGASDAPAGSGAAIGDDVDDGPNRLTMAGCALQVGVFFPPVEVLTAPPDGFSHASQEPAGATGTVIVASQTCRSATEDGSAVEDTGTYREDRKLEVYRGTLRDVAQDGELSHRDRGLLASVQERLGIGDEAARTVEDEVLGGGEVSA